MTCVTLSTPSSIKRAGDDGDADGRLVIVTRFIQNPPASYLLHKTIHFWLNRCLKRVSNSTLSRLLLVAKVALELLAVARLIAWMEAERLRGAAVA
jgi:hypothetical protein